jgi:hypothetical protein
MGDMFWPASDDEGVPPSSLSNPASNEPPPPVALQPAMALDTQRHNVDASHGFMTEHFA